MAMLVTADSALRRVAIAGGYGMVVLAVALVAVARNEELQAGQLLYHWFFANLPATLLVALVCQRRVRAVAPLVLAFMLLGVSGALLFVQLAGNSEMVLRMAVQLAGGGGATVAYIGLHLVGFALLAAVGWWSLHRLGRIYREKRISDQSILLDAVMLLFAVLHCFTLSFEAWGWIFTSIVAYLGYRLTAGRLLRSARSAAGEPVSMLLLRVFALGRRSESLFDQLGAWWLQVGNIDLIEQ